MRLHDVATGVVSYSCLWNPTGERAHRYRTIRRTLARAMRRNRSCYWAHDLLDLAFGSSGCQQPNVLTSTTILTTLTDGGSGQRPIAGVAYTLGTGRRPLRLCSSRLLPTATTVNIANNAIAPFDTAHLDAWTAVGIDIKHTTI